MLIPVIPLPEKSQKECSLDMDYSIPLIPHSQLKLSCLKKWCKGRFTRFFKTIIFLALSQLIES